MNFGSRKMSCNFCIKHTFLQWLSLIFAVNEQWFIRCHNNRVEVEIKSSIYLRIVIEFAPVVEMNQSDIGQWRSLNSSNKLLIYANVDVDVDVDEEKTIFY